MSVAAKLIKNTAYHTAGRTWQIAVNLFLTPLILSYLGDKKFAVWALFWTFSAYFMFMDFGLGVSLVRETSRNYIKAEYRIINQALSSVILFYLLLGTITFGIIWKMTPWLIEHLSVSDAMAPVVVDILHWGVPVFVLVGLVNTFAALLRGFQRYDKITLAMLIASIPNVAGSYLVLDNGFGIAGLIWVIAGVYLLQALLMWYFSRKLMPELKIGFSLVSWGILKEMFPLGARIQVSKLAELASYQTDKILLAFFLPMSFVTMYDLGAKIASLMRDLPYALTSAVFPAASEMHSQAHFDKLWQMYDRGSKYMLIVTLPMLFGLWITAHLLIGMWLGHVSEYVYQSVLLLSLAYWVVISLAMVFSVGTGMGWSRPIMQSALLQALLNIILSFWLIHSFGFIGALGGTLIAISVANGILYFRFCRYFERSIMTEIRRLWLVVKGNIPAVIACGLFTWWSNQWLTWGERLPSFLLFTSAVLIYMVTYVVSLRMFDILDREDLHLLEGRLPMIRWLIAQTEG